MFKNKIDLYKEINMFQEAGSNVYIGKIDDIQKDKYYTNDLCVAGIVRTNDNDTGQIISTEMQFRYVFERFILADKIYYREIFSGAVLEMLDLGKLLNPCGVYITTPIPYKEYSTYLKEQDKISGRKKVRIK